jgi:transcriptional regulator with XRE-family HTH domain
MQALIPKTDLATRLREAIGDEPVAAFGRRCGLNESTLRKYFSGTSPSTENLVAIADAANVSIEWLATGRGPKQRRTAEAPSNISVTDLVELNDMDRLSRSINIIEDWLQVHKLNLPTTKKADAITLAYELLKTDTQTAQQKVHRMLKLVA